MELPLTIRDFIPVVDHQHSTIDLQLANSRFLRNGILMFMSPRCIHCKEMSKELENLKKILNKSSAAKYAIGTVDVTDKEHGGALLSDYFRIVGVPTLMFHNEGIYGPIIVGKTGVEDILNRLKAQRNTYGASVSI